jgi:hypothetical protein
MLIALIPYVLIGLDFFECRDEIIGKAHKGHHISFPIARPVYYKKAADRRPVSVS